MRQIRVRVSSLCNIQGGVVYPAGRKMQAFFRHFQKCNGVLCFSAQLGVFLGIGGREESHATLFCAGLLGPATLDRPLQENDPYPDDQICVGEVEYVVVVQIAAVDKIAHMAHDGR